MNKEKERVYVKKIHNKNKIPNDKTYLYRDDIFFRSDYRDSTSISGIWVFSSGVSHIVPDIEKQDTATGIESQKFVKAISNLYGGMCVLNDKLNEILDEIASLQKKIDYSMASSPQNILYVEEITKEEGKEKVENYLEEHGAADTEELMMNLGISLRCLVDILDELAEEGKIKARDENDENSYISQRT